MMQDMTGIIGAHHRPGAGSNRHTGDDPDTPGDLPRRCSAFFATQNERYCSAVGFRWVPGPPAASWPLQPASQIRRVRPVRHGPQTGVIGMGFQFLLGLAGAEFNLAIGASAIFFVAGFVLMFTINEKEGRVVAIKAAREHALTKTTQEQFREM
jgi:hypothetical protein